MSEQKNIIKLLSEASGSGRGAHMNAVKKI